MWPTNTTCLDSPEATAQAMNALASALESIASSLRELAEGACLPAPSVISAALNELESGSAGSRSIDGGCEPDGLEERTPSDDGVGRRGQELREVRHVPDADGTYGVDPHYALRRRAAERARQAFKRGRSKGRRRKRGPRR